MTGSTITLYAAGQTGYGSLARKMYNTITDATGGLARFGFIYYRW